VTVGKGLPPSPLHEREQAVRDHRRKLIELATRRPELRNRILDELRKFELAKLHESALRSRNVNLDSILRLLYRKTRGFGGGRRN
jgi:hypothetical protein